jgi:hypothetical protein
MDCVSRPAGGRKVASHSASKYSARAGSWIRLRPAASVTCHHHHRTPASLRSSHHLAQESSGRWPAAHRAWCMAASVMKSARKASVVLNDASPAAVHVT